MTQWLDLSTKYRPDSKLDSDFYAALRAAKSNYRLANSLSISPFAGQAFIVKRGQTFRVVEESGPQVGTVALWNADDPRESFIAGRTMAADACFVTPYVRLFSDVPRFRPMVTCLEDTVTRKTIRTGFHHHIVGTHCSPETMEMCFGTSEMNTCRLNLLRAIEPFGLREEDLHDNVNVHQKTYLDPVTGRVSVAPSDARPGDYIEFYAEMNVLVAVSVCPFGDGTADPTKPGTDAVRPLRIEIYDTGTEPKSFPTWTDWRLTWRGRWIPSD